MLLSTSSLEGYGLHHIFLIAKKAEYEGIDLSLDFRIFDTLDPDYLRSLSEIVGIPILSLTAPESKLTKKNLDKILALASELSIYIINLHPPHRLEKERDWFGDYLKVVAKKYPQITINIVNAPSKTWLFVISEYGDVRPETIKKITDHTALSIANVDPSSGVDLIKTFVLLGSTMNFIYLADKKDEDIGLFPGEGMMPLESLLIKLKELKYTGHFTLSVSPKSLDSGGKESDIVAKLQEAKNYLAKYYE